MTEPTPQPEEQVITSPPAKTANEEDHSDPDVFRGDDADAPGND